MKRFNFDEFLWLIILILLDITLIYLIYTGKIELYIGKKMIKYIYTSIVMISILIIFQMQNVFTPKSNDTIKNKLIPISISLILIIISIKSQPTFKHMELNKDVTEISKEIYLHNDDHENKLLDEVRKKQNLLNEKSLKEPIIIDESNVLLLEDIRLNSENYIGKKIQVNGFVCKENYLNKNQFIIGKMVMTCCAADSKVVGMISEWENADNLSENQSIDVKGTIDYSTINDDNGVCHKVPIIRVYYLM